LDKRPSGRPGTASQAAAWCRARRRVRFERLDAAQGTRVRVCYEGPAVDLDERQRLVVDLGPHDAMVMRNHGLLTCGATIQQAFNTMYQLEMSCRAQVDAMAARTELTMPGENVLAHTAHLYQPGTRRPYGVLEWPAMLRLLAAEERNSGYPAYWN